MTKRLGALLACAALTLTGCAQGSDDGGATKSAEVKGTTTAPVVSTQAVEKPGTASSTSAVPKEKPAPVLGRAGFQQYVSGFGTARPNGISFASTASSTIGDIEWESWGDDVAIGVGLAQTDGPQNPRSQIWLRAGDLGWCDGVWAYRSVGQSVTRSAALKPSTTTDVCQADRSEPGATTAPAGAGLSAASKLTFGGVGGVHLGDSASTIPNTYVSKDVLGMGKFPAGSTEYYFRPKASTYSRNTMIFADENGKIAWIIWPETDRGIAIGSTRAEVEKAYGDVTKLHCRPASQDIVDVYRNSAGKAVFVAYDGADNVRMLASYPAEALTDGGYCPFE